MINDYNGTPIYAGGDDLLFFCPVAHSSFQNEGDKVVIEKHFLSLIKQIDDAFDKLFTTFKDKDVDFEKIIKNATKKPSMSYGVSISYYKFPLNEALAEGVNQLFNIAKQTCKKDAVSYSILKHSGQFFETTFHKKSESYKTYNNLLTEQIENTDYIHSVVYKLNPQKSVFLEIGSECEEKERNILFDNFFKNNFDESIHIQKNEDGKKELIPFLRTLKQLFKDVYTEDNICSAENESGTEKWNKKNLDKIYTALRFIQFVNNKEER